MTKDEIIKLAREARFAAVLAEHASEYGNGTLENTSYPQLEAFAALVAAAEREACAAMFDDRNVWDEEVGERIRARGQS
jgi:hypothetical protein